MIPDSWERRTIAELCEMVKGSSPISKTKEGQFPLVTTGAERKTADHYQFDAAAVCVPMISSTGHGHASLKRVHYQEGKFALANLLTALIVRDQTKLSPRFLHLYLNFYKDELLVPLQAGAANMSLTIGRLATVPIRFPPLAEQVRILRILDETEELHRLRDQADHRTTGLIPAIFHEMFGDPATNPKGWKITRAGDLMTLCEYGTSQKAARDRTGIPILRMGNVETDGTLNVSDLKFINLSDRDLEKYLLVSGDVLFNRTNSRELVGKTGMWDGRFKAVAASYFIRVRFDSTKEHPQHFTTFMNLPLMKTRLMKMARGAVGQANINAQELKAIEFPLPPLPLQHQFAARVAEMRALEESQVVSRNKLNDLFQALLHRAFRGEL